MAKTLVVAQMLRDAHEDHTLQVGLAGRGRRGRAGRVCGGLSIYEPAPSSSSRSVQVSLAAAGWARQGRVCGGASVYELQYCTIPNYKDSLGQAGWPSRTECVGKSI